MPKKVFTTNLSSLYEILQFIKAMINVTPNKENARKQIGTHTSSSEKAVIMAGTKKMEEVIAPKIAKNLGKYTFPFSAALG